MVLRDKRLATKRYGYLKTFSKVSVRSIDYI